MQKISEKSVTVGIRSLLDTLGIFHWKVFQTLGCKPGVSDIIGIRRVKVADLVKSGVEYVGQFVAIEVKRPGGKATVDQERFLANVHHCGGIAILADSVARVIVGLGAEKQFLPGIAMGPDEREKPGRNEPYL